MSRLLVLDPALHVALRATLSLLFFWAAAHKLRDLAGFRAALAAYALLPQRSVAAAAALVVAAESGIATGLLLPGVGSAAALAAACLLGVYGSAIGVNLLRGRLHIDCGCAGAGGHRPISLGLVARNGVLAMAVLAGALPAGTRGLMRIDALTIGAGVVTVTLLYLAVDGLIANAPAIAVLAREHGASQLVQRDHDRIEHA